LAQSTSSDFLLAEAADALHTTDSAAFLVRPRILRRIINQDRELPGLGWSVPHRKSYIIDRDRLLRIVVREELGMPASANLPETVILIAHPDKDDLVDATQETLLRQIWRMLFHARIHFELDQNLRRAN